MKKRIAVVGAGAVGGYLGGHLARTGNDVTLIDPWPEHVEAIRSAWPEALRHDRRGDATRSRSRRMHLTEVQSLSKQRPIDIAIVSSKSYDTEWATMMIRPYLSPDGFVVSAQNSHQRGDDRARRRLGPHRRLRRRQQFRRRSLRAGPRPPHHAARLQRPSRSIVGEAHGRITPRIEELRDMLAAIDGAARDRPTFGASAGRSSA